MLRYLHTLSAVIFYILGASFFLAYVLAHNGIAERGALAWLSIGDMPLALAGILFGGTSIYKSVRNDESVSRGLLLAIGLPLLILFIVLLVVNFWPQTS